MNSGFYSGCGKKEEHAKHGNSILAFISRFVPEKTFPLLGVVLTAIGTVIIIVSLSPLIWLTIVGVGLIFLGIRCVK